MLEYTVHSAHVGTSIYIRHLVHHTELTGLALLFLNLQSYTTINALSTPGS